jgi:hypothetical protein
VRGQADRDQQKGCQTDDEPSNTHAFDRTHCYNLLN